MIAVAIALTMLVWLGSGVLFTEKEITPTIGERNVAFEAASRDAGPTSVRTLISTAQLTSPLITLRAFAQNERTVVVRTETDGRIRARPVQRGSIVEEGDLLCELEVDDRQARLEQAVAARKRAELDYAGAMELWDKALISDVELAERFENLSRTQASESSQRIERDRVSVRAPFGGVVEETHVEIGDFLKRADACVTLLDLDPMLIIGQVSEFEVDSLTLGDQANVVFLSGERAEGRIRFLGRDSQDGTRTYRVEVEVPNPNQSFRSGVTAEIQVPLAPVSAHKVTPNLLRLDDIGRLGLYAVSAENRAEFHPIDILRDDDSGFFVTGLPRIVQLVVRGQGTLAPGQSVEPEQVSALSSRGDSLALPGQGNAGASIVDTPAG